MNIYLPIEIKARELEGRTLLALAAAERGHQVLLGGKEDTLGLSARGILKPGIVHDKSLTPGQLSKLLEIRSYGHMITAQDEEHGLIEESYDSFAKRRFGEETLKTASRLFCWGAHDEAALQRIYSKYAVKFVATGSPRVDLWRPEFDSLFPPESNFSHFLNPRKCYVLISSTFGSILNENPFWVLLERLRRWTNSSEEEEINMYYRAARQYQLLGSFVNAIRRLANTYTDISFVVRPHPKEAVNAWSVLLGDYENIQVIREGGMSSWIRGACALIHNGCTSSFEAAAAGTPVVAYCPIKSDFEHAVPNSIGYKANLEDELIHLIGVISSDNFLNQDPDALAATERLLAGRFSNLKGKFASDRIVDEWERLATPELAEQNDWQQLRQRYKSSDHKAKSLSPISSLRKKMEGLVRATLRPNKQPKPQSHHQNNPNLQKGKNIHKFPYLAEEELQDIINRYQVTLGRFHSVKVERFGLRSFILYRSGSE